MKKKIANIKIIENFKVYRKNVYHSMAILQTVGDSEPTLGLTNVKYLTQKRRLSLILVMVRADIYRMRAIISRGLYIFYPIFQFG